MSDQKESNNSLDNGCRLFATLISALICGYMMYLTNGVHGIGWFVFSLFPIWVW
jgi:hypothetical protein